MTAGYIPNNFLLGVIPKEEHFDRLQFMLKASLDRLDAQQVADGEIKDMTQLIYDSMTTRGRVYHSMQHVFDMSKEMVDPEIVVSALFHDVIYYTIDKQFSDSQKTYLKGCLESLDEPLVLAANCRDDKFIKMVVDMYGLVPGEPLPRVGTNEFLSAIVAVQALKEILAWDHLVRIAACIEATIPFRGTTPEGKNPMDRLYDRLSPLCEDKSPEWLVETVQKAVTTANWDLGSFNSADRDYFLDSTWKLMPEGRSALHAEDCPLSEFVAELKALLVRSKKMPVPIIFQSFRDFPTQEEMDAKRKDTYDNLAFVIEYGKVRLLQVLVLEAFIKLMGQDPAKIPMRPLLHMDISLEEAVGSCPAAEEGPIEKEIRKLLVSGRRTPFPWDPPASPLAACLWDGLGGQQGVATTLDQARAGEEEGTVSFDWLKTLPPKLILQVATRMETVLPDQAESLQKVPETLGIMAQ